MNLSVTVLHNVSRDVFLRYNPKTSRLHHAHTFQVVADNIEQAANLVWVLANVDDADHLRRAHPHLAVYANQVAAYRARQNRSLSVSDVLVFHDLGDYEVEPICLGALAVVVVGHERLGEVPVYESGSNETRVSNSRIAYRELLAQRVREELAHGRGERT